MVPRLLPVFAATLLLAGCANFRTPASAEPPTNTQTYLAAKPEVIIAAKSALTELGYSIEETVESSPTTVVSFGKPFFSLSWHKSGKLSVTEQTPTITDVSTKDSSSQEIFKTIRHNLPQ